MSNTVVQLTLGITIVLLAASIWVISRIRSILQRGRIRMAWFGLGTVLLPALLGCLLFLHTNDIEGANHHEDLLIASTLFAATVFVFGVCAVSLFTARELARIDDLERKAFFDPLTNLYTRGHIDSLLSVECERSKAATKHISVMLLDVDDFKFVNDCYGHRAGDHVLKEIGRILKQTSSTSSLVGRYGGEEFLIVSPKTSPVLAEENAERLRKVISAASFEVEGKTIPLTVSVGVMTTLTFRESAEELVRAADDAMYAAKRRGRNQVVVADGRDFRDLAASDMRSLSWTEG